MNNNGKQRGRGWVSWLSSIPMINTITVSIIIYGLVIPVITHGNKWVGSALAWATTIFYLFINWRGTFPMIFSGPLNYFKHSLVPSVAPGGPEDINVIRVLDLYISTGFAESLVWFTMWVLDDSLLKNQQLQVVFPVTTSPYYAYLSIVYNSFAAVGFIGSGLISPIGVPAYLWGLVVTFVNVWGLILMVRWLVWLARTPNNWRGEEEKENDPLTAAALHQQRQGDITVNINTGRDLSHPPGYHHKKEPQPQPRFQPMTGYNNPGAYTNSKGVTPKLSIAQLNRMQHFGIKSVPPPPYIPPNNAAPHLVSKR